MEEQLVDNNSDRILWLDIAKAIAIIFVVIGHTIPVESSLSKFIYLFHMPLFFLISGYLLNFEKYELCFKNYLINSAKRLLLPCVITIIFYYDFKYLISNLPVFLYASPVETSVCGFLIEPIKLSMWFLFCLFLIKIFLFLYLKILKHYNINLFFGIVISFIICLLGVKIGSKIMLPWSFDIVMVGLYISYLGYLIKYYKLFNKKVYIHIILTLVFVIMAYVDYKYYGLSLAYRKYTNPIISVNAGIAISILFFYLAQIIELMKNNKFINKFIYFISYLGINSIIIMIAHGLIPDCDGYIKTVILRIFISVLCIEVIARIPVLKDIFGAKTILKAHEVSSFK